MLIIILSQISDSGQVLIWPEFSWVSLVQGVTFLTFLFAIVFLFQKVVRVRNQRIHAYREMILAKLNLRAFYSKDVILLHEFLHHVTYSRLRKMAEVTSWYSEYFIPQFLEFIGNHTNLPAWKCILLVQTLDRSTNVSGDSSEKYLTGILQINTKENVPIVLECPGMDADSVDRRIPAKIYAKRGADLLSHMKNPKVQLYFRKENHIWFRSNAVLRFYKDTNLTLQIKSAPEEDAIKTKEWVDLVREKKFIEPKSQPSPKNSDVFLEEYMDSISQILAYSGLQQNICGQIRNLVKTYKEHPGYIRREHKQEDYKILIRLYKACFVKFRSQTENVPKPVLLFMYFFFLDETLVSNKRIIDLEASIAVLKSASPMLPNSGVKISIHLLPDWLNLVLGGKKNPSKNQMGQSYDQVQKSKLLWNQGEEVKNLRDKEYLLRLLDWELDSLLYTGLLGISLNPNLSYPILSEDRFYGNTEASLLYPRKISSSVEQVLKMDAGLFNRLVCVTSPLNTNQQDWIRKEFFADCILLPYAGDRGVLWQETSDGNLARSRLLFPTVFKENIGLAVTKTLGEFRWETERTFRGRKWKDSLPVTLTSQYNEYLEMFQKDPDLTSEAKKKVEQQWSNVRRNIKDMFSVDYANWILYEVVGKPRLNRNAREILTRFVPTN